MTLFENTLNIVGGIPDTLFTKVGTLLREKSHKDYAVYMKSLNFYPKLKDVKESKSFFDLPKSAPKTKLRSEEGIKDGTSFVFTFKSLYKVKNPTVEAEFKGFKKNQTSTIQLWQHDSCKTNKIILCLHGFMLGDSKVAQRMFKIKRLYEKGTDVALYTLPHHGERTNRFYNQSLICPHNLPLTVEGISQALFDLHSTILFLREQGYKEIGLIGASLGGYLSLLYVTLKKDLSFIFTVVPAVNLQEYLLPSKECFSFSVSEEMEKRSKDLIDLITPENYSPLVKAKDISVVIHSGDLLNDHKTTRAWAKKWGVKQITEVVGGHWLYFDKKTRGRTWYQWLEKYKFISSQKEQKS